MWLLDTTSLRLQHFSDDRKAVEARYAILSHTWGDDEVSFRDMTRGNLLDDIKRRKAKKKTGFVKIEKACEQARKDRYRYVWIDTCCIDKDSSAELSEAINSMYRWYADAAVCYAYLADVVVDEQKRADMRKVTKEDEYLRSIFMPSRWFRRGWTLQELIAPAVVRFYDAHWVLIDTKAYMARALSEVTGIDKRIFRQRHLLKSFSVATRMSWAAHRETTRLEDEAYSLLGIFDVNMPMVYGEGYKAFLRLQEEIIKISTDHSIFAWSAPDADAARFYGRLLAPNPRCFAEVGNLVAGANASLGDSYEISNSGLRISLPTQDEDGYLIAQLNCQIDKLPAALRLKIHRPHQEGSARQNGRPIVCEVDRSYAKGTRGSSGNLFSMPGLTTMFLRVPLETHSDIVILRDTFTAGINVLFELSPGLKITTASPPIADNRVYLSSAETGDFSQGSVTIDVGGIQERLFFGQFLQQRSAESTFRLYWERGFDPDAPDDISVNEDHDLRFAQTSTAHQSWAQTTMGMITGVEGPEFRQIEEAELLSRQHVYMRPERGEYLLCFEALASLHFRQDVLRDGEKAADDGQPVSTPASSRLEDLFWVVSLRAVLWGLTANGACVHYVMDEWHGS